MAVAWQLYCQKPPVLPRKFEELRLSPEQVQKMVEVAYKVQKFLSRFLKKRKAEFFHSSLVRKVNLLTFIGCAGLLGLPLPIPLSNTIPAIPILLMAFAYLEEDGYAMILSWFFALMALSFFVGLAFFAQELIVRAWS